MRQEHGRTTAHCPSSLPVPPRAQSGPSAIAIPISTSHQQPVPLCDTTKPPLRLRRHSLHSLFCLSMHSLHRECMETRGAPLIEVNLAGCTTAGHVQYKDLVVLVGGGYGGVCRTVVPGSTAAGGAGLLTSSALVPVIRCAVCVSRTRCTRRKLCTRALPPRPAPPPLPRRPYLRPACFPHPTCYNGTCDLVSH